MEPSQEQQLCSHVNYNRHGHVSGTLGRGNDRTTIYQNDPGVTEPVAAACSSSWDKWQCPGHQVEGLPVAEHPGVRFRPRVSGTRVAAVIGGPDVWEIIRQLNSLVGAEEGLGVEEVIQETASNYGLPSNQVPYCASLLLRLDAGGRSGHRFSR